MPLFRPSLPSSPAVLLSLLLPVLPALAGPPSQSPRLIGKETADGFHEIVARPLFRPWRRAEPVLERLVAPDAGPPPQDASLPDPGLTFLGTLQQDGRMVAIVVPPGGDLPVHLGLGDEIDGWRVTRIEPRRLVIEARNGYEEYTILE